MQKNALGAAREALDAQSMNLDAARVGAGVEDPDVAIENIMAEKRRIAAAKVKGATGQLNADDLEAERFQSKRDQAQSDEKKMGQIQSNSKSPAVRQAARKMQEKESDEQIRDLEKVQEARKRAMRDKFAQREALEKQGDGEARLQKIVGKIQDEMTIARKDTKDIMDFEGEKFAAATKEGNLAKVEEAKNELAIADAEKTHEKTSSLTRARELQRTITERKAMAPLIQTKIAEQSALASGAVQAQHVAAQELKEVLESGMNKIIAAKVPTGSEEEEKIKGQIHVVKIEEATQKARLEANLVALNEVKRDLSTAQSARVENEKEVVNMEKMLKTVKKNPLPELPKGVSAPQEIEAQKEAQMQKKMDKLHDKNAGLKSDEVKFALKVEDYEAERDRMQSSLEAIQQKLTMLGRELKAASKAEWDRTKGPVAQLRNAQIHQVQQYATSWRYKVEDDAEGAKHRAEDIARTRKMNGVATPEEDKKIADTKGQINAVQQKLADLKNKISPTAEAEAESGREIDN